MTRIEAEKFIEAFKKLREIATDDRSLQVPSLYPTWKEGKDYVAGERILYEGVLYKVLQNHTSLVDWTPLNASSLFAKVLVAEDGTILEWEQPDSTNPYMKGDKVIYEGKVYECLVDYNIHSPVDYPFGWQLIE